MAPCQVASCRNQSLALLPTFYCSSILNSLDFTSLFIFCFFLLVFVFTSIITSMARNSLLCADVPLRHYSLTPWPCSFHSVCCWYPQGCWRCLHMHMPTTCKYTAMMIWWSITVCWTDGAHGQLHYFCPDVAGQSSPPASQIACLESVLRAAALHVLQLPGRAPVAAAIHNSLHWLSFPQATCYAFWHTDVFMVWHLATCPSPVCMLQLLKVVPSCIRHGENVPTVIKFETWYYWEWMNENANF